jgi:cytochrome c-type biogenesis protein
MPMATRSANRALNDRWLLYFIFAALALGPLLAFGVGPLTGEDFSLTGPGGPLLAFSAGVLSFLSPCVLPIVPIYITHLSGAIVEGGKVIPNRGRAFAHAAVFMGGFSLVVILLGTAASLLGLFFFDDNRRELTKVAGAVMIVMGILLIPAYGKGSPIRSAVCLLGLAFAFTIVSDLAGLRGDRMGLAALAGALILCWLRFSGYLPLSVFSRTFEVGLGRNRQVGYARSGLVGAAFAIGWTPCIGPILGGIYGLTAATSTEADPTRGLFLLAAYCSGFSIPFLATGLAVSDASSLFKKIQRFTPLIEVSSAVMLVGIGMLLWYGALTSLNQYFDFGSYNPSGL